MVNMVKVSDKTLDLILNDALGKLGFSLPLTEENRLDILDYFWEKESSLANAKESYNENVDEDYLNAVSNAVSELSNEDISLDTLNDKLISRK